MKSLQTLNSVTACIHVHCISHYFITLANAPPPPTPIIQNSYKIKHPLNHFALHKFAFIIFQEYLCATRHEKWLCKDLRGGSNIQLRN